MIDGAGERAPRTDSDRQVRPAIRARGRAPPARAPRAAAHRAIVVVRLVPLVRVVRIVIALEAFLVLLLHHLLQLGEVAEELLFLMFIEGDDLAQLAVEEGDEEIVGVGCPLADERRALVRFEVMVGLVEIVLLLLELVDELLEGIVAIRG